VITRALLGLKRTTDYPDIWGGTEKIPLGTRGLCLKIRLRLDRKVTLESSQAAGCAQESVLLESGRKFDLDVTSSRAYSGARFERCDRRELEIIAGTEEVPSTDPKLRSALII
jgi:hypothetical protein